MQILERLSAYPTAASSGPSSTQREQYKRNISSAARGQEVDQWYDPRRERFLAFLRLHIPVIVGSQEQIQSI